MPIGKKIIYAFWSNQDKRELDLYADKNKTEQLIYYLPKWEIGLLWTNPNLKNFEHFTNSSQNYETNI